MAMKERNDLGRTQGFSLIEILVVVGVIAVMGAVSLPAVFNFFRTNQIRAAAQEVAGEIQATRLQAIKRNANFGVVFVVLSDSTYRYFSEDAALSGNRQSYAAATAVDPVTGAAVNAGYVRTLPTGVRFTAATVAPNTGLRFSRLGSMCKPDVAITTCPDLTGITPAPTGNFVNFDATSDVTIVLQQDNTALQRTVVISRGGRIRVR